MKRDHGVCRIVGFVLKLIDNEVDVSCFLSPEAKSIENRQGLELLTILLTIFFLLHSSFFSFLFFLLFLFDLKEELFQRDSVW